MTSYTFYDGPSELTGEPIVGVATFDSKNRKTGPLIQTYILDKNHDPVSAHKNNHDRNICGECPLKTSNSCYVLLHQGPLIVYKQLPRMKPLKRSLLHNRVIRLGAYGDPAAIPLDVWDGITKHSAAHTGYTHQWRKFPGIKKYCQASTEDVAGTLEAQALGFKTYRIRTDDEPLLPDEVKCPYPKVQCLQCGLCNGQLKNVSTVVHGSWQVKKFMEMKNDRQ